MKITFVILTFFTIPSAGWGGQYPSSKRYAKESKLSSRSALVIESWKSWLIFNLSNLAKFDMELARWFLIWSWSSQREMCCGNVFIIDKVFNTAFLTRFEGDTIFRKFHHFSVNHWAHNCNFDFFDNSFGG